MIKGSEIIIQECPTLKYSLVWQSEVKSTAKICPAYLCSNVLFLRACPQTSIAAWNEKSLNSNPIPYKKEALRNKSLKRALLTKN